MGTVAINLVTYFFEKCFEWFFAFFPWDLQVRPTQRGPTVISSETPSSDATLYDGRGWRNLGETTEIYVVEKEKKKKKVNKNADVLVAHMHNTTCADEDGKMRPRSEPREVEELGASRVEPVRSTAQ
jgi:hypothetical protein